MLLLVAPSIHDDRSFAELNCQAIYEDKTAMELWEVIKNNEYKKLFVEKEYLKQHSDVIGSGEFTCAMDHSLLLGGK